MKPLITALLLILGSRIYAVAPVLVTYVLSWQDPSVPPLDHFAPNTNSLYKLYSTATIGTPATNWPLVATFTNWTMGTNGKSVWFTNTWSGPPQDTFFYLTASNFFGEQPSFFAPLVHSGPLGLNPTNTTLGLQ